MRNILCILSFLLAFNLFPAHAADKGETLIRVRLLILKHAWEQMADDDANLAIQAVQAASSRGLRIENIGNHFIDRDGKRKVAIVEYDSVEKLKSFVSEQMKVNPVSGDTFIVFTIGHGFGSGDLQRLGQRVEIMKALAAAAEENEQETLWWQLSCHATARLPMITELPKSQQGYFSMLASSTAEQTSSSGVQGRIMERVFVALAEKSTELDPNGDEIITMRELRDFLNKDGSRRGTLLFAASEDEQIFGGISLANRIRIIDRNNPQREYPRNYIPLPRR